MRRTRVVYFKKFNSSLGRQGTMGKNLIHSYLFEIPVFEMESHANLGKV